MDKTAEKPFLPAAGRDWALPLYDPLTKLFGIGRVRESLLEGADLARASRTLDIGCGTGTLALAIKRRYPHLNVVGIDPDPKALEQARQKADRASAAIQFIQGFSEELHYGNGIFDRVFSSFMFHHVPDEKKPQMLREVFRVLAPGGSFHMLDMARSTDQEHQGSVKFHGMSKHMMQNSDPLILKLLQQAGFSDARVIESKKILFRTVRTAYFRGSRAHAAAVDGLR